MRSDDSHVIRIVVTAAIILFGGSRGVSARWMPTIGSRYVEMSDYIWDVELRLLHWPSWPLIGPPTSIFSLGREHLRARAASEIAGGRERT